MVSVGVYVYGLASLMARPSLFRKDGSLKSNILSVITGYIPIVNVIQVIKLYASMELWINFRRCNALQHFF